MEKPINLKVEGPRWPNPIGETLRADKIIHGKNELEVIEITVSMVTLKKWQEKITGIIERHDLETSR